MKDFIDKNSKHYTSSKFFDGYSLCNNMLKRRKRMEIYGNDESEVQGARVFMSDLL